MVNSVPYFNLINELVEWLNNEFVNHFFWIPSLTDKEENPFLPDMMGHQAFDRTIQYRYDANIFSPYTKTAPVRLCRTFWIDHVPKPLKDMTDEVWEKKMYEDEAYLLKKEWCERLGIHYIRHHKLSKIGEIIEEWDSRKED